MNQWSFDKILYFLRTAEMKSFSEAARDLYVTPQALNKQITLLEKVVGGCLFERNTRGLKLTAFGQSFYNTFQPVKESYYQAIQEIKDNRDQSQIKMSIQFFNAISKRFAVVPIVRMIQAQLPDVSINLNAGELDDVLVSVRKGDADIGITNIHDYEDMSDFDFVPLITRPAKVVVAKEHRFATKDKITVDDLERNSILLLKRMNELSEDSFYSRIHVSKRMICPYIHSMIATLELGKSYAVMPEIFENMKNAGFIYFDLPDQYKFNYQMVLLCKKNSQYADLCTNMKLSEQMLEKMYNE